MNEIEFFNADFVILDTETTGLNYRAEIVEISIIDKQRNTLFDSLIKPKNPIPWDAECIDGISNSDVSNAPTWADVYKQVKEISTHVKLI